VKRPLGSPEQVGQSCRERLRRRQVALSPSPDVERSGFHLRWDEGAASVRAVPAPRRTTMDDHIYRVIEIVGTSQKGVDDAIKTAIDRASSTLRNLRWFEVARTSGHIENGKVQHFQVTLKVGFTMEGAG